MGSKAARKLRRDGSVCGGRVDGVLLAWVYYAAQVFLVGAEFTKVYADEHGSARTPSCGDNRGGAKTS